MAFKEQVNLVLNALVEQFPFAEEVFTNNAENYMLTLDRLHLDFETAFGESSDCTSRIVAANHNAYSYISERYNIEFITVHGLDPEGEPSASDIAKVVNKIKEDGITVLFVEEYTKFSAVQSIVDETGVEVRYLYTMEKAPLDDGNGQSDSSDDYVSLMYKSLESLKYGLGCTV